MDKAELIVVLKNFFLVMFLFIVIFTIFLFIFFYISLNLSKPTNGINLMFRRIIISNHILRKTFRLHQLGDARYDYANDEPFSTLRISLFVADGLSFSKNSTEEAIEEFRRIVSSVKNIVIEKPIVLYDYAKSVDDKQLNKLLDTQKPEFSLTKKTASLHIFLIKRYTPKPGFIGLTKDDHSIVLFSDAMDDVARGKTQRHDIEVSTILHEFAHLLGADHTDAQGCILSEELESETLLSTTFATTFCHSDRLAIEYAL